MDVGLVISVLAAAIAAGTAILYACLGEILCERAGVLNLGVEGMMLMGALSGFAVTYWTSSPWLGAVAALVMGGLLSLIHAGTITYDEARNVAVDIEELDRLMRG